MFSKLVVNVGVGRQGVTGRMVGEVGEKGKGTKPHFKPFVQVWRSVRGAEILKNFLDFLPEPVYIKLR